MYRLINSFFLIVCFFLIFCGSNKKIQFSKKYIPIYNPEGEYFFYDQKFAKSYELYQKRRDALKEKIISKYNRTPKTDRTEKKITQLSTQFADDNKFSNNNDAMVNGYGIDLARLKGAKFIEVIDDSNYYEYNHEEEKPSFVTLLQKIETEFEEVGHDISLKMKNLHKKKSTGSNNRETIVNFNDYDKVECGCSASGCLQEEDYAVSDAKIETLKNEPMKDEFISEEPKTDTE